MARIDEFFEVQSDARKEHGPVKCGHRTFTVDGRRLLQLDTYGSTERQIADKISQSIQLDLEGARELVEIIRRSFPELR